MSFTEVKILLYLLTAWNGAVLLLYGFDKLAAKWNWRRVPERVLLGCAFLFGSVGAGLGMLLFRHKTRKPKFTIGVPLALLADIAASVIVLRLWCG